MKKIASVFIFVGVLSLGEAGCMSAVYRQVNALNAYLQTAITSNSSPSTATLAALPPLPVATATSCLNVMTGSAAGTASNPTRFDMMTALLELIKNLGAACGGNNPPISNSSSAYNQVQTVVTSVATALIQLDTTNSPIFTGLDNSNPPTPCYVPAAPYNSKATKWSEYDIASHLATNGNIGG